MWGRWSSGVCVLVSYGLWSLVTDSLVVFSVVSVTLNPPHTAHNPSSPYHWHPRSNSTRPGSPVPRFPTHRGRILPRHSVLGTPKFVIL